MGFLDKIKSLFLPNEVSLEERRKVVRIRCHLRVKVDLGRRFTSATVVDMGPQGMRLKLGERVRGRLQVTYSEKDKRISVPTVGGRVLWCRKLGTETLDYIAGVAYEGDAASTRGTWVYLILREIGLDEKAVFERRRHIRVAGQVPLAAEFQGRVLQGAGMVDVGAGGLLLNAPPLREGSELKLTLGPYQQLPALALNGVVVSRKEALGVGYLHGVRFVDLTTPQVEVLGTYVLGLLAQGRP